MGAIGKQWSAACGQKEAQCCWCGRVVRLAQMKPGCGLGEVWNQNASVAAVCVTPECKCRATCERSKVEVTTLDEQSPCEGLSSARRHSHVYR